MKKIDENNQNGRIEKNRRKTSETRKMSQKILEPP
jgi:hypothetical protein